MKTLSICQHLWDAAKVILKCVCFQNFKEQIISMGCKLFLNRAGRESIPVSFIKLTYSESQL